MLEKYSDEVNLLLAWYTRAKEVTIKAESMDVVNLSYVQPMHEQRYCLDHFMRAISFEQEQESDEVIIKSINSAIGHLQRAYSDSIEWILLSVKEKYLDVLNKYTNEQINTVFPEYYSDIRPAFERITEAVNKYKVNKSIERATNVDALSDGEIRMRKTGEEQFLAEDFVDELENYLKILHQRENLLIEIKARDRKATIRDKIVWPIVTGVIGGLLVATIMH